MNEYRRGVLVRSRAPFPKRKQLSQKAWFKIPLWRQDMFGKRAGENGNKEGKG